MERFKENVNTLINKDSYTEVTSLLNNSDYHSIQLSGQPINQEFENYIDIESFSTLETDIENKDNKSANISFQSGKISLKSDDQSIEKSSFNNEPNVVNDEKEDQSHKLKSIQKSSLDSIEQITLKPIENETYNNLKNNSEIVVASRVTDEEKSGEATEITKKHNSQLSFDEGTTCDLRHTCDSDFITKTVASDYQDKNINNQNKKVSVDSITKQSVSDSFSEPIKISTVINSTKSNELTNKNNSQFSFDTSLAGDSGYDAEIYLNNKKVSSDYLDKQSSIEYNKHSVESILKQNKVESSSEPAMISTVINAKKSNDETDITKNQNSQFSFDASQTGDYYSESDLNNQTVSSDYQEKNNHIQNKKDSSKSIERYEDRLNTLISKDSYTEVTSFLTNNDYHSIQLSDLPINQEFKNYIDIESISTLESNTEKKDNKSANISSQSGKISLKSDDQSIEKSSFNNEPNVVNDEKEGQSHNQYSMQKSSLDSIEQITLKPIENETYNNLKNNSEIVVASRVTDEEKLVLIGDLYIFSSLKLLIF